VIKKGAQSNYKNSWPEPDDHCLGRSRGGFSTKAHVAVDGAGRPLAVRLTGGQAGDNPQLIPLLDQIAVPTGGRPRKRPDALLADKAYSHPSTREALRGRRIPTVIPQRSDQIAARQKRGLDPVRLFQPTSSPLFRPETTPIDRHRRSGASRSEADPACRAAG
jgi:transposase